MHSVIETPVFTRRADDLLNEADRTALIETLAANPLAGALIPGMGGVRKLRFAAGGKGKSGAFRVIYYVLNDNLPILAILRQGRAIEPEPGSAPRDHCGR